jgi:hypothetical protein
MTSNRAPIGVEHDALWRDRLKLENGADAWHKSPRAKRLYTTPEMRMQQTKRYGDPKKYSHMGFQGTTMAAWFQLLDSPRQKEDAIKKMRNHMGMQAKVPLMDESANERAMNKWTHRNERLLAETSPRVSSARESTRQRSPEKKTIRFGDGFEMPATSARSKMMEEGQMQVPWRRHDDVALTTALAKLAPRARGTF